MERQLSVKASQFIILSEAGSIPAPSTNTPPRALRERADAHSAEAAEAHVAGVTGYRPHRNPRSGGNDGTVDHPHENLCNVAFDGRKPVFEIQSARLRQIISIP